MVNRSISTTLYIMHVGYEERKEKGQANGNRRNSAKKNGDGDGQDKEAVGT